MVLENTLRARGLFKNDSKLVNKGKPRGKVEVDLKNIVPLVNG
jgi:hypothetical protein